MARGAPPDESRGQRIAAVLLAAPLDEDENYLQVVDDVERRLASLADDLNERQPTSEIEVLVDTRWRGPFRSQGLCAYNLWTDVFEPVRRRWPWMQRWRTLQPPEDAARKIEWFLTNRPDLPAVERPATGDHE